MRSIVRAALVSVARNTGVTLRLPDLLWRRCNASAPGWSRPGSVLLAWSWHTYLSLEEAGIGRHQARPRQLVPDTLLLHAFCWLSVRILCSLAG